MAFQRNASDCWNHWDQRSKPNRAAETPRQAAKVESAREKTTRESKRNAASAVKAATISRCQDQAAPSGVNLTSI